MKIDKFIKIIIFLTIIINPFIISGLYFRVIDYSQKIIHI